MRPNRCTVGYLHAPQRVIRLLIYSMSRPSGHAWGNRFTVTERNAHMHMLRTSTGECRVCVCVCVCVYIYIYIYIYIYLNAGSVDQWREPFKPRRLPQ
jgi:hypothetical protein